MGELRNVLKTGVDCPRLAPAVGLADSLPSVAHGGPLSGAIFLIVRGGEGRIQDRLCRCPLHEWFMSKGQGTSAHPVARVSARVVNE